MELRNGGPMAPSEREGTARGRPCRRIASREAKRAGITVCNSLNEQAGAPVWKKGTMSSGFFAF